MERPARLHHRHVEGAAVVGDEDRRLGPRPLADRADQRLLRGEAREHELADQEAAVLARQRAADQERHGAGAAREAGRLEIEIEDARPRRVGGGRIAGDERDVVRRHARVAQLQRPVPVGRRVVALDHQRLAERPVDLPGAGQRRRQRRIDERQAVVADRLVGQLARAGGAGASGRRPGRCPSPARAGDRACSCVSRPQNGTSPSSIAGVATGVTATRPVSRCSRSSATRLPRGPISPIGPTQDGQPRSHSQLAIRSALASSRRSWTSKSGALKPIPPG